MTITGIFTAIVIGIVVGVLGRLALPGKQPIGMLLTILVGIVSAFVGTALAVGTATGTGVVIGWLRRRCLACPRSRGRYRVRGQRRSFGSLAPSWSR